MEMVLFGTAVIAKLHEREKVFSHFIVDVDVWKENFILRAIVMIPNF